MPKEYLVAGSWPHALLRMTFTPPDTPSLVVSNPAEEEALRVSHFFPSNLAISYFFYGFTPEEVKEFFVRDAQGRRQRYPFRVDLIRIQYPDNQFWNQLNLRPPEGDYRGDRLTIHRNPKPDITGVHVGTIPLCIPPYHLVHMNEG